MRSKKLILAAGATLAALALVAPAAIADPTGPPTFRQLAGTGSDTTQDVMNGLSDVITIGGARQIGSYNASGAPASVVTKDPAVVAGCTYQRSELVGSSAGVNRLQDSLEGVSRPGCLDFARSSSGDPTSFPANPPGGPGRLSWVPFAVDALTFAIRDDSPLPNTLSITDPDPNVVTLRRIYDCAYPTTDIKPLLPQAGSGTRAFFLAQLGYTTAEANNFEATHPCVRNTDPNGQPLLENTGTLVADPLNIVPYSIAQYLSQINRVVGDVHGRTVLGQVNGVTSTVLNTSGPMKRDVYNVIPTNRETTAPWSTVFVGGNSLVCQSSSTITKYGFGVAPNCGVITIRGQ